MGKVGVFLMRSKTFWGIGASPPPVDYFVNKNHNHKMPLTNCAYYDCSELMFPIASSTALITNTASDVGIGLLAVLGIVLTAWAGLVALGYFTRKTTKKVTGHKY